MTTASIFNYFRKAPSQTIASPSKLDIGYAIYNGITKAQHISYHQMFSLYTNFPTTYHLNTNKPLKNITLTHPELIAFEKEYDELLSCKTDQSFEKIAKIFEAVHQNIDNIELHQWMVGEILAKALAIIPFPPF